MNLSKQAFGQIIQASATSENPIAEDYLREIATAHGDDPDAIVEFHDEMREGWQKRKLDNDEPMPVTF